MIGHLKKCARCGSVKPSSAFYRDDNSGGVLSARCRDCHGLGDRTCIVCSRVFVGIAGRKLCSPECRAIHRPQTFLDCERCGRRFGPVQRLAARFCSRRCAYAALRTGVTPWLATPEAKLATRAVQQAIRHGVLARPETCEECGERRRIEGAHLDYARPLDVRWLCIPCHRAWDKVAPKGGAYPAHYVRR